MMKPNSVLRWSKFQTVNLFGDTQGKHFAANFAVKGVGVKTVTALVASYLALTFFCKKVQSIISNASLLYFAKQLNICTVSL